MCRNIIIIAVIAMVWMLIGVILVRYGIGLGHKMTIASQNDIPLGKKEPKILQEFTGED